MTRKCKRCGYEWFPRKGARSRICPHCRSTQWDKDVLRNEYRFRDIWIGQTVVLPWFTKNGAPDLWANQKRLNALNLYASRTGKKFSMHGMTRGLTIKRMA